MYPTVKDMCFDGYKVSETPVLELYLTTLLSFYVTQVKIIISVICRETVVVSVCFLSVLYLLYVCQYVVGRSFLSTKWK